MVKIVINLNHKNIKINHTHNNYNLHILILKNNKNIPLYHLNIKKIRLNKNIIKLNVYKILKIIKNQNLK